MKIRPGFVSNSSSTSFLVIAKEEFNADSLRRLMGVDDTSPLAGMFDQLYSELVEGVDVELDLSKVSLKKDVKDLSMLYGKTLSAHMLERLNAQRGQKVKAFFGYLSSDNSPVESFFCTDSFEEENDQIYINGLENAW